MTELKPCPFCGAAAKVYAGSEGLAIVCTNCGARTTYLNDSLERRIDRITWATGQEAFSKAVYSWNTRETDTVKFNKEFLK